jgi:hypothetical protein
METDCILLGLADIHSGHKLALLNPKTELREETEDGDIIYYNPRLTHTQEYLWELFVNGCTKTKEIANGKDIIVLYDGDLCWGKKYPEELVSTRVADQISMAVSVFSYLIDILQPKILRIVTSTNAHNFGEATADILVTDQLKSMYPNCNIEIVFHGLGTLGGIQVDYTHHGPPPGKRAWLKGNEAMIYLNNIMMGDIMAGKTPPRLFLRANYHEYVEVTKTIRVKSKVYRSTLIVLPSFMMLSDHARQVCKSPSEVVNGMVAFEIINGKLVGDFQPLIQTVDIRTKEIF